MVCDGAKVGCAMHDGIIGKDIEKTVRNLGRIGSIGMQNTDNMILDIMVCK